MDYYILAINPGSTSTKIAVYKNEEEQWKKNIEHSEQELRDHKKIGEQLLFRKECVCAALAEHGQSQAGLSAIAGRGGMLPPVKAGGYRVNDCMRDRLQKSEIGFHASNLGALVADAIASPLDIPAYIYDAVSSDEMYEIAHITGMPEVYRQSFCHVLNAKATCRKVAGEQGQRYENLNFLVGHLGGGISISAHEKGKIVDVISEDGGPFSPERSGSVPLRNVVLMCYSGEYNRNEMLYKIRGMGGIKAHLGVHDCREVEKMIVAGNERAKKIYEAQAYQIAKGIGELAPVLSGKVDFIILTGGVSYSQMLTNMVKSRVEFIAPVKIMPGENELESLALGVLRILRGEEIASEYVES